MAQMKRTRRLSGITKADYSSMFVQLLKGFNYLTKINSGHTNPMITLTGTNSHLLNTMF